MRLRAKNCGLPPQPYGIFFGGATGAARLAPVGRLPTVWTAAAAAAVQTVGRRNFRQLASSAGFPGWRTSFWSGGGVYSEFLQAGIVGCGFINPRSADPDDPGGAYPEGAPR